MFELKSFGPFRLAALFFAFALPLAPSAEAVERIELEVPKSAECPEAVKEVLGAAYRSGNGFGYSFYKDDSLKAQTLSTSDGTPLDQQPALLEQVRLLARNLDQKTILITYSGDRTRRDRHFCGWVPWNALVVSRNKPDGSDKSFSDTDFDEGNARSNNGWWPRFLTVGELVSGAPKGNSLFAKALIQTANTDAKAGDTQPVPGAPEQNAAYRVLLYDKPGGSVIGAQSMFSVFNIIDAVGKGEEDKFYLLAGARDKAVGWVREKDQLLWPSRMAVFWAGTGKAVIYPNLEEFNSKGVEFTHEPQNVAATLPKDHNVERFPVLGPTGKLSSSSLPNYFQIAFIGRNPEDAERDKVVTTLASLDNIDILFVIDATQSMNFLFQDVAQAVRDFAGKIESEDRIQVGVMVYGDYINHGRDGKFQLETVVPFGRPSLRQRVWTDLIHRETFKDDQGDKPEAVFASLKKAAETAHWRPAAPIRVMIHIGDAGNREPGLPHQEKVNENLSESDVAAALAAKSISYFPIAVSGAYDSPYNEALVRQVRTIVERSQQERGSVEGGLFSKEQITYDTSTGQDDARTRQERIGKALSFIYDTFRHTLLQTQTEMSCAQSDGKAVKCRRPQVGAGGTTDNKTLGGWLPTFSGALRDRLGIDPAMIERIYSRPATSISGFAPTKVDGAEVFSYWVALDPQSFHALRGAMDSLCPKIIYQTSEEAIESAMRDTVRAAGGDEMQPNETFQEYFVRVLYIPALALNSPFMKYTPKSLFEFLGKNSNDALKMQERVCRFSAQLGEMTNDLRTAEGDWVWDKDKTLFQSNKSSKFVWLVKSEFGLPLYYVPLKDFP